jgi:DNA-binding transcriptional LysR family regulator
MTLEQLRIFIAVAEKQHVTQAAGELNLTQSATSAAIAALEARYDIKLFDRIGRGIVLTQTGRDFLVEARAVLARARAAAQVLNDLAGLKRGSLTIAASQTVANYWLPGRLQAFHANYPGIDLHVSISNTEQVAGAVLQGSADLGFVEGEVDDALLAPKKIDGDALIMVVGAKHPWVGRKAWVGGKKITPKDLLATAWVLREHGSGTRSMFETALRQSGIKLSDLRIALELPSNEAVRTAVETGDCATAISDLVVSPSLAAKTLHRVKFDLPRRSFYILRHKERHISRIEQALLKSLQGSSQGSPQG